MMHLRFSLVWILICFQHLLHCSSGQEILSTTNSTSIAKPINLPETTTSTPLPTVEDEEDDDEDSKEVEKSIYDYGDDYDQPTTSKNTTPPKIGIVYSWAKWPKWNKCSRTCGGGVQIRIRNCIEKKQSGTELLITEFQPGIDGRKGCFGVLKKYRMCNQKACPKQEDIRNQQCAVHNKLPYKGKLYEWEGYTREHHECELNCKPVNLNVYTTFSKSVIDGTPCSRPAVYYTHSYRGRAVCVEGICKAVHKSGAIRGATTNDLKIKCGSVLCRPVSEIFSKPTLPHGYFYITTIGSGATNITVKQMASSENRLAIRSVDNKFVINGNNHMSVSGTYEYNGDAYDYDKDLQTIEASGPITKSIDLLLLVRGVNPGIKYDYYIPIASAGISDSEETETHWNENGVPIDEVEDNKIPPDTNEVQLTKAKDRKRRKFSWKLLGFGPCNRSCGAGVRSPIFRCIRDSPTRFYTPRRCMFAEKPVFNEDIYKCNLQLCPAYWQTEEYGECVCTDGVGQHNRTVKCVQEQASGVVEFVDDFQCVETKPVESEHCDCPKKIRRKIYSHRSDKSARIYSRLIGSTANVYNSFNQTQNLRKGYRDDRDKSGVWLMSEWNEQCSAHCSSGLEHRSIYCDRTAPYTDLCDLSITPERTRSCDHSKRCTEGVWFTSPWGNCTGNCFNLVRRRSVLCVVEGLVVEDEGCDMDEKPSETKNCTHREVSYCGPKWHYSEWSECSRSCGEGIQRRYAKCLEFDWKENSLQESNNCKYIERQPVYGTCNTHVCDEIESHANSLQTDLDALSCTDEFSSCKRINKSRLCKVHYYQKNCCQTCGGHYL